MDSIKNNKLGIIDEKQLKIIEYYLFNIKYHIIDESYTFNEEEIFNIKYLEKIHLFLFSDVYHKNDCKIRAELSKEIIEKINNKLQEFKSLLYTEEIEQIKSILYEIWEQQIFYDGNTRTILSFLKIISKIYDFNITYDFTKDIDKDYFINEVIDSIEPKNEKNR
jgi:fido (protein-threonine AMPylation protein)